jgi:hypothetical protein
MPASWRTCCGGLLSPTPLLDQAGPAKRGEGKCSGGMLYPGWRSFLTFGSQPPRDGCPKRDVRSANCGPWATIMSPLSGFRFGGAEKAEGVVGYFRDLKKGVIAALN